MSKYWSAVASVLFLVSSGVPVESLNDQDEPAVSDVDPQEPGSCSVTTKNSGRTAVISGEMPTSAVGMPSLSIKDGKSLVRPEAFVVLPHDVEGLTHGKYVVSLKWYVLSDVGIGPRVVRCSPSPFIAPVSCEVEWDEDKQTARLNFNTTLSRVNIERLGSDGWTWNFLVDADGELLSFEDTSSVLDRYPLAGSNSYRISFGSFSGNDTYVTRAYCGKVLAGLWCAVAYDATADLIKVFWNSDIFDVRLHRAQDHASETTPVVDSKGLPVVINGAREYLDVMAPGGHFVSYRLTHRDDTELLRCKGSTRAPKHVYPLGVESVVEHGASSNRLDVVLVGDGYTAAELPDYEAHVEQLVAHWPSNLAVFNRYWKYFNVHRIDVASIDSLYPVDIKHPPTGLDTALGTFQPGICLAVNVALLNEAISKGLEGSSIDADMRLVAVNNRGRAVVDSSGDVIDYKSRGCAHTTTTHYATFTSAENPSLGPLAAHEAAHLFGLGDEYWDSSVANVYQGDGTDHVNVALEGSDKWDRWLGYVDPDSDLGEVGYYEGAAHYAEGLYRPTFNSIMRSSYGSAEFDAIAREQWITTLYEHVSPLDDWSDVQKIYNDDDVLWVKTVDPSVVSVDWRVDGISTGLAREQIDIASLGLADGKYSIEAHAYDAILDHAFSNDSLDWWRHSDDSLLRQTVCFEVVVGIPNSTGVGGSCSSTPE